MKNILAQFSFGVLLLSILQSCSSPVDDQSRRGGGLEIPNGLANVVIRLTDSEGQPLRKTAAKVIAGESWGEKILLSEDPTLFTLSTDSMGLVNIPVNESRVFVWSQNDSQGIFMPIHPIDSLGNSRSNPLPIAARNLGAIQFNNLQKEQVGIFGTTLGFEGDRDINFSKVPAGLYMLVAKNEFGLQMGQTVEVKEFSTIVDAGSMIFSDPNNLMLTNFENRRVHKIWEPLHVGGYWWVSARVNGADSWDHVNISSINDILDSADGNIFAGIDVNFQGSTTGEAYLGLDFRTEPINTNLSRASAIRFQAKGEGTWKFFLETQNSSGENLRKWFYTIVLNSEWQDFQLALDQFSCELCPDENWNSETRMGINMFWGTENNGSIRVDDIVLEGLEFQDWVDP